MKTKSTFQPKRAGHSIIKNLNSNSTSTAWRWGRIFCFLFPVAAVVAAVGAVASPRANQGSMRLSNALPATIIVVTNTNNGGPGSLRNALAVAKDGDTIDATGVSGTILLTSGELNVDKNVTIGGPGANHLSVDGNAQSRVFFINAGKTVTISGLTITNGNITNDWGGGLSNVHGMLTVSDCIISGNSRGGILNDEGTLTVSNCTISGNSGGGIFSGTGPSGIATVTITNSAISGNSADYGGGILNAGNGGAALTVSDSSISGNSANYGGGILNTAGGSQGGSATVILSNSTLNDNSAVSDGGGICNSSGRGAGVSFIVKNSTISGNSASGNGGGIYNAALQTFAGAGVTVINSTLSGNSSNARGGGIYNSNNGGSAAVVIGNTILNAGASGENIFNDAAMVNSLGYNVSSDKGSGLLTGPGDQINTDPLLGPLHDNGGPTFTHALLPGSPAIDTGDPKFTPPPSYDQRGPGFDRVMNGRIDIGSFEVQGPTPTATPCGRTWVERSPVPYNAGGMFATSDGTYIYTGAGGDINAGHNDLLRYDPANNSWMSLAPSPDQHALSQAVYFKGKLYNMAGFLGDLSQVSNTTRIYDIATNTWTTGKPVPATLGAPATMLWDGIIYVAGGYDGAEAVDTLYAYNIASNTWSTLAPMPQALYAPGFGAINGKLYVASGYAFGTIFNTLQIYDIATDTWTTGRDVPHRVGYAGSAVFDDDGTGPKLYLYGGVVQSNPRILTNITQIYDPDSNAWTDGPNMNVTRWWVYGTAVGNDSIVAPGGANANIIGLDDNEQLACATPTPTATPTATATATATSTPTPTPRPSPIPRPRPTPAPRP